MILSFISHYEVNFITNKVPAAGITIIESAAYCNQIVLVPIYLNSTQKSLLVGSVGQCNDFYVGEVILLTGH